ncbi:MAG TPA: penicillin-binding transpeptidase domain-containing protein [Candidatus Binatia bacterium]|nr:penicillin-binding transpeptidase domain-containing protein [Candidatus Binatia bacterium]
MLFFDQLKKSDPALRTLAWGAFAGMVTLLAGLWYVQVVSYRQHTENQKAQSYRTVRIPAIRGKILDANGQPLAENRPTYNVNLYLDELRAQFKQEWKRSAPNGHIKKSELGALQAQARYRVVSNIVQHLATVVQVPVFLDFDRFMNHYTNQLALPLPILTNLTPSQVARFQEQPSTLPGLDLDIQPTRVYPRGQSGAHMVGFLRRDDSSMKDEDAFFNFRLPDFKGQVGLEGAFDQVLRGRAGVKSVLVNNLGYRQSETIWAPADPGKNLVLTINLDLQHAAEKALAGAQPDVRGAVVIMDPNNGDILALVSIPSYDPNLFLPRVNRAHWDMLMDEDLKPTRSRATQENYQPGSIFKIVTALACLEAGLDPYAKIYNPRHIFVGRRKIDDTAPEGEYDFRRAFILSSNTYFITNGLKAGVERIVAVGHRLHFGERTGIPTWQDNGGIFPTARRIKTGWVEGETANLCIGQGEIAVTPLQMAVMASAIANGGTVFWPRLVARIETQDLLSGEQPTMVPQGRVRDYLGVSPRSLRILREAMLADVEDQKEGGGRLAAVSGFRVCGKTGTAQIMDIHNRVVDWTTWFASYAPYENPRYAVIVTVESGKSGGSTCAPVAQKIYQAIQQYENQSNLRMTSVTKAP